MISAALKSCGAGYSAGSSPFRRLLFFLPLLLLSLAHAQTITTSSPLPSGTVGVSYSTSLTCTNCTNGTWGASGLPANLTIAPNTSGGATISGTPTTAGTYTAVVTLQVIGGPVVTKPFSITINAAPLSINNTSFPTGTVNVQYPTQTLSATGGVAPYSWSVSGASLGLPPGLAISGSTIAGTPTASGTYSFNLTVFDSQQHSASRQLSITINPASAGPLTITSTSFPTGTINVQYPTQTLTATGGFAPYTWSASGLPPGLAISGATIVGTPTSSGTFQFTLSVFDSQTNTAARQLSITINAATAPLSINNTSFPTGTINVQYPTQNLTATGGVPPYSWSVSTGLPPGLAISGGSTIVGTPTASGTYNFILTVVDSAQHSANNQFSITINGGTGTGPVINTTQLPSGIVNQPYTAQLVCTNCAGYTWSVTSGQLPSGLQLNAASGAITGTPIQIGVNSFQITITGASTFTVPPSASQIFSLTINAGGLSITTASLPVASQNTAYSTTLAATGGTTPYAWSFTSTANDGLTIGASTGIISGTPTATGQFTLNVQVTDNSGLTATRSFTITVSSALSILTTSLPAGTINVAYPTQTISAGGGQPPYRWVVVTTGPGNLPPGLTLDGVFGRISGTPTASGTFTFELMVTDNNGNTATGNLSITVGGNIVITPSTLPNAAVGTAYSQTLTATGGQSPYGWAVTSGSLPVGLTIGATTGLISGTPTLPGSATFTVTVTDSTRITGTAAFTLIVSGSVTITTTSLPDGTIGTAYSQTLAATGGTTPYTWAVTTGTLPAGLTLAAATGVISGTPTAAATSSFTVTVTDAGQTTARQALSITTAAALTVTPTTLPPATVGTAYSQKFTAAGGKAPYTFALTGSLPAGFTFTASTATIAGTAAAAETGSFTITVTDASSRTVSLPLTLTASATPLTVTPATLPTATVGLAYSQVLTASGGVAPYTFALTLGTLPAGFSFNATTHTISGTAAAAVTGNFTITVTDSAGTTVNDGLTLIANNPVAPTLSVTLGGPASGFMQQLPVTIAIGAPYPVTISGAVSLTFAPSVTPSAGVADGMIQFASGGTSISFTIPAGSTAPTFPSGSNATILTGTTAGTITVTTSLTVNGTALSNTTKTIVNNPGVPFISSVAFQQTPGGITVTVVGFSSTRDMVSGLFHFAPATGVTFTSGDITVPLATPFSTWWSNTTQSNPYGTQFTLTAPFSLSTQSTSVVSVTVTLTNSKGASNPVTLAQ
jgi:hypothetical protein